MRAGLAKLWPFLALFLLLLLVLFGIALIINRPSTAKIFEESFYSAQLAQELGQKFQRERELLRISRLAQSEEQWQRMLRLAFQSLSADPSPKEYRFFTLLAQRATAGLPGNEEMYGYWIWGLLRRGKFQQAYENTHRLKSDRWSGLRAESRLRTLYDGESEEKEWSDFLVGWNRNADPELLRRAALLTESAELSLDTALLYMRDARPDLALAEIELIKNGSRYWYNPENPLRHASFVAFAKIAQDAGDSNQAIEWLSKQQEDKKRRRLFSWKELGMIGDLYWARYLFQGNQQDFVLALESWTEAKDLISLVPEDPYPIDSWRIWLNLSILELERGQIRQSQTLLDEALQLFPETSEVMAAWASHHKATEPALVRRLLAQASSQTGDPLLVLTALQIDPEFSSPRLYSAGLWELFDTVTSLENKEIDATTSRKITSFFLDYTRSLKDFVSLDLIIDRYRRRHPSESWILLWRLVADVSRGYAPINFVARSPYEKNPYEEYHDWAMQRKDWQGLYDLALFAVLAALDLEKEAENFPDMGGRGQGDFSQREAAFLSIINAQISETNVRGNSLEKRLEMIVKNQDKKNFFERYLSIPGRRGVEARSLMNRILKNESLVLFQQALTDIRLAQNIAGEKIEMQDKLALYYLEAVSLNFLNHNAEATQVLQTLLALDPHYLISQEFSIQENQP